jgi:hypothetical protein
VGFLTSHRPPRPVTEIALLTYQNFKRFKRQRLREFENRVLMRIFVPRRDEVTGGWRKLHNEELHNLFSSPSIITMIKSKRIRWAGHAAQMDEKWNAFRWECQEERGH